MRGHIRKRGNSWSAAIYLGRDGEGKRQYSWATFPTRDDAERYVSSAIHMIYMKRLRDRLRRPSRGPGSGGSPSAAR
jgi:hypothetical protein